MMRQSLPAGGVAPKRLFASRYQARGGVGVSTCKKRHLMAETNEFLSEPGDDTSRPAIQRRGHTFKQRRYLRDTHGRSPTVLASDRKHRQAAARLLEVADLH